MSVSLAMIVRDEVEHLERCVRPVLDLVDEFVCVDTGSHDGTPELARSLGAKVIISPWTDDFSQARNTAISHASGDWILSMDADDRLVPPERGKLKRLLEGARRGRAYTMGIVCLGSQGDVVMEVNHIRLFERRPEIRWKYRVHEQLLPALEEIGAEIEGTAIRLVHTGYCRPQALERKKLRNLRLAELDAVDQPNDPVVLYNVGAILSDLSRHGEAIVHLRKALGLLKPGAPYPPDLWLVLGKSLLEAGDLDEALHVARDGRWTRKDDVALAVLCAELEILNGDSRRARTTLTDVAAPTDKTSHHVQALTLLAEVSILLDDRPSAERIARELVEQTPQSGRAWLVLADALLMRKDQSGLDALQARLSRVPGAELALRMIEAARAKRDGNTHVALQAIDSLSNSTQVVAAFRRRIVGETDGPLLACLTHPFERP